MNLHQLAPAHKAIAKKRIGRGGKRGTYSGRGVKGQKARAGSRIRPGTRDLIQSIPKLRGSRNMGARKRKQGFRRKENTKERNA